MSDADLDFNSRNIYVRSSLYGENGYIPWNELPHRERDHFRMRALEQELAKRSSAFARALLDERKRYRLERDAFIRALNGTEALYQEVCLERDLFALENAMLRTRLEELER